MPSAAARHRLPSLLAPTPSPASGACRTTRCPLERDGRPPSRLQPPGREQWRAWARDCEPRPTSNHPRAAGRRAGSRPGRLTSPPRPPRPRTLAARPRVAPTRPARRPPCGAACAGVPATPCAGAPGAAREPADGRRTPRRRRRATPARTSGRRRDGAECLPRGVNSPGGRPGVASPAPPPSWRAGRRVPRPVGSGAPPSRSTRRCRRRRAPPGRHHGRSFSRPPTSRLA
jgi:hypothetical protein